jgi:hypothetical protein
MSYRSSQEVKNTKALFNPQGFSISENNLQLTYVNLSPHSDSSLKKVFVKSLMGELEIFMISFC